MSAFHTLRHVDLILFDEIGRWEGAGKNIERRSAGKYYICHTSWTLSLTVVLTYYNLFILLLLLLFLFYITFKSTLRLRLQLRLRLRPRLRLRQHLPIFIMTRSVLILSIHKVSVWGSQILEPLLIYTSTYPVRVQISQELGSFSRFNFESWP